MAITTTDSALLRMLQLASPALPVGAYAFSQGLEYAIESRWLDSAEATRDWLLLQLREGVAEVDLPLLLKLQQCWLDKDRESLHYWNAYVLACRETAEFRLAEIATGEALGRLLPELGVPVEVRLEPPAFITLFAAAAAHWQLQPALCAYAYLWSWLENQVMAATKLLPLGQTRAQQLLQELQQQLPALVAQVLERDEQEPGAGLPGVALSSSLHETQYSRLFRS